MVLPPFQGFLISISTQGLARFHPRTPKPGVLGTPALGCILPPRCGWIRKLVLFFPAMSSYTVS